MAYTSNIPGTLTVKVKSIASSTYTFTHTFQEIADYMAKTDGQAVIITLEGTRLAIASVSVDDLQVYTIPEDTFTFSAADSNVADEGGTD